MKSFNDIAKLTKKYKLKDRWDDDDILEVNIDKNPSSEDDKLGASDRKKIAQQLKDDESRQFWDKRIKDMQKKLNETEDPDEIKEYERKIKKYFKMRE